MCKETALFSLQRSKGVYWQFLLDFQNCAGKQCNLQCRFCHRTGHLTHCETGSPEITLFTLGSLPSGESVSVYIKSMHLWTCAKKRNSHNLTLQSHWLWDTVCSFSLWTTSLLGWEGILHISKAVYLAPGDDANGHLLRITQLLTPRFNNIETGTNSDQTHSKSHYNSKTDPKKNL